jgi:hypothetical protein
MGAGSYSIETDVVYNQGSKIKALEPSMLNAGTLAFGKILDASGIVVHPAVSGALTSYHAAHVKSAHTLAYATGDCGVNLATGANTLDQGQNDASVPQAAAYQQAMNNLPVLTRDLSAG